MDAICTKVALCQTFLLLLCQHVTLVIEQLLYSRYKLIIVRWEGCFSLYTPFAHIFYVN